MGIKAETDSHVFTIFCEEEINSILTKTERDELDYLKAYVFLHFVLEIRISFLFRLFLYGTVFLKTPHNSLTIEEIDKKDMREKFDLLECFLLYGITQDNINRLKGRFSNFAEKRNKIAHGHKNGTTYDNVAKESKVVEWMNDVELKKQIVLYNEIIDLFRLCIDKLPTLSPQGKADYKNELIDVRVIF